MISRASSSLELRPVLLLQVIDQFRPAQLDPRSTPPAPVSSPAPRSSRARSPRRRDATTATRTPPSKTALSSGTRRSASFLNRANTAVRALPSSLDATSNAPPYASNVAFVSTSYASTNATGNIDFITASVRSRAFTLPVAASAFPARTPCRALGARARSRSPRVVRIRVEFASNSIR